MARLFFVIVLGACAGLSASAFFALALRPEVDMSRRSALARAAVAASPASLCRNIFDQSGSLCVEPPPEPIVLVESPSSCASGPRLVGTWIESERSFALFAGMPGPVPLGADVGQQQLLAIGKAAALFGDAEGNTCERPLFEADYVALEPAVAVTVQVPVVAALGGDEQVRLVGDEVRLSADLVTELFRDPQRRLGRARLLPGPDGARVYGVGRSDLLYRAGLRSGDVIVSVDGSPLTSFDSLVEGVASAMSTGRLRVSVRRRGGELMERTLVLGSSPRLL